MSARKRGKLIKSDRMMNSRFSYTLLKPVLRKRGGMDWIMVALVWAVVIIIIRVILDWVYGWLNACGYVRIRINWMNRHFFFLNADLLALINGSARICIRIWYKFYILKSKINAARIKTNSQSNHRSCSFYSNSLLGHYSINRPLKVFTLFSRIHIHTKPYMYPLFITLSIVLYIPYIVNNSRRITQSLPLAVHPSILRGIFELGPALIQRIIRYCINHEGRQRSPAAAATKKRIRISCAYAPLHASASTRDWPGSFINYCAEGGKWKWTVDSPLPLALKHVINKSVSRPHRARACLFRRQKRALAAICRLVFFLRSILTHPQQIYTEFWPPRTALRRSNSICIARKRDHPKISSAVCICTYTRTRKKRKKAHRSGIYTNRCYCHDPLCPIAQRTSCTLPLPRAPARDKQERRNRDSLAILTPRAQIPTGRRDRKPPEVCTRAPPKHSLLASI